MGKKGEKKGKSNKKGKSTGEQDTVEVANNANLSVQATVGIAIGAAIVVALIGIVMHYRQSLRAQSAVLVNRQPSLQDDTRVIESEIEFADAEVIIPDYSISDC